MRIPRGDGHRAVVGYRVNAQHHRLESRAGMVNPFQDVGRAERVQVAFFQLQRDDVLTAGRLYVRYRAAFGHPPFGTDDLNPVVTQFGHVQPFPKG